MKTPKENFISLKPTSAYLQALHRTQNFTYHLLRCEKPQGWNIPGAIAKLKSLEVLYLRGNKLKSVPCNSFNNLKKVQVLYLSYNRITTLENGASNGLNYLKELYLKSSYDSNQLEIIEDGVFRDCRNLETLNLDPSKIYGMRSHSFDDTVIITKLDSRSSNFQNIPGAIDKLKLDQLDVINGAGFNKVEILQDGYFQGSYNTETLSLEGHQLKIIIDGVFRDCRNLKTLNLGSNKIYEMESRVFDDTVNLTELDYRFNNLQNILGAIAKLKSLEVLNLSGNKLKSVPPNSFSDLNQL
ncbi:hypothetical protein JTB14_007542 [Gonioctena quinquepunctata]|nr:hypothetical protein JTB14_007542 [Gonioctena quinquepunctata]